MKGLLDILKGKWLKHPLHPAVAHVPAAVWPAALLFDALSRFGVGGNAMVRLSFSAIILGLAAALVAVPTGLADWAGIKREKPAWKIGLYHMALNLVAALLFAVNLGVRVRTFAGATEVAAGPLVLSAAATVLLLVSIYLGGFMVFEHGTSVARQSKQKWRKIAEAGGADLPEEK